MNLHVDSSYKTINLIDYALDNGFEEITKSCDTAHVRGFDNLYFYIFNINLMGTKEWRFIRKNERGSGIITQGTVVEFVQNLNFNMSLEEIIKHLDEYRNEVSQILRG